MSESTSDLLASKARQAWTFIGLLVLVHAVVDLIVCASSISGPEGGPLDHLEHALPFSQFSLLVLWASLGTAALSLRLSGALVGLVVLISAFSYGYIFFQYAYISVWEDRWTEGQWSIFFGAAAEGPMLALATPGLTAFIAVPVLLCRRLGLRITRPMERASTNLPVTFSRKFQFSLRDLLTAAFAVGLSFGIVAAVQPYPRWALEFLFYWWSTFTEPLFLLLLGLITSLDYALITIWAAWAVLSPGRPTLRICLLTLIVITVWNALTQVPLMLIVGYFEEVDVTPSWQDFFYEGINFMFFMLIAVCSLLVVRTLGYRLQWK